MTMRMYERRGRFYERGDYKMKDRVILILVDGMRPDGMLACGHPFVKTLLDQSASALDAQTVFPPVTLPCHVSLFYGVVPDRHGVVTNTYVPQVRPIEGLFERLDSAGKRCSMFYSWEELRDLSRPGHLSRSLFISQHFESGADVRLTDAALNELKENEPDFTFLYLGETDYAGHDYGWMGERYLSTIHTAFDCIERVCQQATPDDTIIVTADHGGHGRNHGDDVPEDMTIPIICRGKQFAPGSKLEGASILDIAPTISDLLGVTAVREWEGKVIK